MDPKAIELVHQLWLGLGILLATNVGTIAKLYLDARATSKAKLEKTETDKDSRLVAAVEENTAALKRLECDLQRLFTAIKIIAGKKWSEVSKIIQDDNPRRTT